MPYIGSSASPLPVNFAAVQAQSFDGTGSQTAFTLSRTVPSAASIEVLVNNVQQSPYDASYSVAGTTLTFSEAPSSGTNNVYVVYRDQAIGSLVDESAYRKAEVDSAVAAKVSKAGDTMTGALALPAGGLNVGSGQLAVDASGRVTMPYQPGFRSGSSTFNGSTGVASAFATSSGNTGGQSFIYRNSGHFNTTTGKFTAPVAGKYLICATYGSDDGAVTRNIGWLYINGSNWGEWVESYGPYDNATGVVIEYLNVNDYIEFAVHPGIPYSGVVASIDFLG